MIFFSKLKQYKNISRVIITRNKSTKNPHIVLPKTNNIKVSSVEKTSLNALDTIVFSVFNIPTKPVELPHYNLFAVIHLFTKSVPYLQMSQESFNRICHQLHRLSQIFSLFYAFIYMTKGQAGENLIRENPKFKALFNSTISKELFNQESQLVNYISLQMKYIHKEIFSILLKESQFFLNPEAPVEISNFLTSDDFIILHRMCIPIRNLDFIKENQEKTLKINANYLLNHLILNYQERRGVYYSFIKAYDTLYNGNLYNQVNNYLKTLSIFFRMYTVLAELKNKFALLNEYPELLTDSDKKQLNLIKALPPFPHIWDPLDKQSLYIALNANERKPTKSCGKQILILLEEIISVYREDLNMRVIPQQIA